MNFKIIIILTSLTCFFAALTSLHIDGTGTIQKHWTVEHSIHIKYPGATAISPDGLWVVYPVTYPVINEKTSKNITHLWLSKIDGSHTFRLTNGEANCYSPSWSPDGKNIAFLTSRRSGTVNIWLIPPNGGEAKQLTREPNSIQSYKWSQDGKCIAFLMEDGEAEEDKNARERKTTPEVMDANFKYTHLYRVNADERIMREAIQVTSGPFNVTHFDWSPDGSRLVFSHAATHLTVMQWRFTDISFISVHGGRITPLVTRPGMDHCPLFSPDGRWVAFVSTCGDQSWGRDFRICLIPVSGSEVTVLPRTHDSMPGDIEGTIMKWSKNGNFIYYFETKGMDIHLFAIPVNGRPYRQLTRQSGFKFGFDIDPGERFVTYCGADLEQPDEVFVEVIGKKTGNLKILTDVNGHLPVLPFAPTEMVKWRSFDGLEIQGLLTYPLNYVEGKRYPLVLLLHGGPTYAYVRDFTAYPAAYYGSQLLAAKSFAILKVNVRGSSGRGKRFRFANIGDLGGNDLKDALAGVDDIIDRGIADPERLAVLGVSYGGQLAGMAISRTRRFKAAVIGFGVLNMISDYQKAYSVYFHQKWMGGFFWENEEFYRDRSPIFHIAKITTPTLLFYCKNDPYIPYSQGLEFYNSLKAKGTETQLVLYPRSGHGVREPKLVIDNANRIINWVCDHLKKL